MTARFYRPLVERLRREGVMNPRGRGGYRGRFRSFDSDHGIPSTFFSLSLEYEYEGKTVNVVCFEMYGEHHKKIYDALYESRMEIQGRMGGAEIEYWREVSGKSEVGVIGDASGWGDLDQKADVIREWMFKTLATLKKAIQPALERIRRELYPADPPRTANSQ